MNKDNMKEMLKASTNKRYLEDIINQASLKVRKAEIEQDKKEVFIESIPAIRHYGYAHDATDEVLEFLEGICSGAYNLSGTHWIHDASILMEHYEHLDAEDGEASERRKKLQNIERKYTPHSAHSQSEVSHFREGMKGSY
ncbi:MAG: hypothetical protein V1886_01885 [archaeon]